MPLITVGVGNSSGTSTTAPGDSAFPVATGSTIGLTKREFIASRLLTGMLAGNPIIDASQGDLAKKNALKAVVIADYLIAALNGTLTMP